MNKEEVLKLAKLARIDVPSEEVESLASEIGSILNYIGEIKSADVGEVKPRVEDFVLKNIFRDDSEPHPTDAYSEALLKQAPNREGDYIKVKKIL